MCLIRNSFILLILFRRKSIFQLRNLLLQTFAIINGNSVTNFLKKKNRTKFSAGVINGRLEFLQKFIQIHKWRRP